MLNLAGAFAELEREIIRERVKAGLANPKGRGRKVGRLRAEVMMVTTPQREEWCEHCLHPIGPSEAVFEAYRLVGEFERKVYFHARCFNPANPAYFDALERYSDDRVALPIKAPSKPAAERAARSRGGRARSVIGKVHQPRRHRSTATSRREVF